MNIIEKNLSFKSLERRKITRRIITHHSASTTASPEDIHRWHLNKGYVGAGYQYLVRKDGKIYSLRPEWAVGAHAYGSNLNKEMAENIVHSMKPYGQHWSIEETQRIQEQFGMTNINPVDFYIVLNSAYNDYNNIFNENMEMYVSFTNDFINDEDAKSDKVFLYFTNIPNN